MSDGTNNFNPISRNWQALRGYGDYAPNTGTMSGGTNNFLSTSRNWQDGHDYGDHAPNGNAMNGGTNTSMPTSRNWQARRDYGDYGPNTSDRNNRQDSFPRRVPISIHDDPVASRGAPYRRQLFQEGVITEPFGLPGSPVVSDNPVAEVSENSIARERQFIRGSSPGFLNPHNMQVHDSRLIPDGEEAALKKLRKEIYTPTQKKRTTPTCLYYRENAIKIYAEREKERENDVMSCAVCLEDFVTNETVMVTPCNHRFHEACIVPWVKSNGHCPVCRFAISKPKRRANNTAIAGIDHTVAREFLRIFGGDDIVTREHMAVLRSMEEILLLLDDHR